MFEKLCMLNTSPPGGYSADVQVSSRLKSFIKILTVGEIYENGK
jgi:hypothetical protein